MADATGKTAAVVVKKTVSSVVKSKEAVFQAVDQNGDGQIGIEDVIIMGLNIPGIKINREAFLRKELFKYYPQEVIDDAVQFNPLHAKIKLEDIDKIANEVIKYERNCVSGISAALGAPGGVALLATIPADLAQYYGSMLRVIQKLLYFYGFREINTKEQGDVIDSETMNMLIICMGVMYGVAGVNNAIKAMAKAFGKGVERQLMNKALTKGTIYPIVKSVSKWFGVKMTKDVFAGFFKKSIPVVGGVIGGGITFFSFKPCCDRLKLSLQDTMLSNPNYNDDCDLEITADDVEIIDVDVVKE
ncbi:MAG: EcsC family protein [Bacteroidetes bacterium]|nr:EcsC family protein [Bacteroidota bacterium]